MPPGQSPHLPVFRCGRSIPSCFLTGRGHPPPASCQSDSGSGQAHGVLTSGHWEAPKPCVLWFWYRGWGGQCPPSGGLATLWSLTVLAPGPFRNSGKLRGQQGLGRRLGPLSTVHILLGLSPLGWLCSFVLQESVVTPVRWPPHLPAQTTVLWPMTPNRNSRALGTFWPCHRGWLFKLCVCFLSVTQG